MADVRLQQLDREYGQELASTNTKFAFSGFGRSTIRLEDAVEVGQKHQERVAALNSVIFWENKLKSLEGQLVDQEVRKNADEQLRRAIAVSKQLAVKAKQRRAKLYGEVVSVGQLADSRFKRTLGRSAASRRSPKSFKLKIQPFTSKIKPLTGLQGAKFSQTGRKTPSFGSKFTLSRLKSFGYGRNLSGKFS